MTAKRNDEIVAILQEHAGGVAAKESFAATASRSARSIGGGGNMGAWTRPSSSACTGLRMRTDA